MVSPDNASTLDAVVIGGGPAGAAVARMLATRGHSVVLLTKPADAVRSFAETLPPTSAKVIAAVGLREAIGDAGFMPTRGNTVWWGSREGHVEPFAGGDGATGLQIIRPDFDRILLAAAAASGVAVHDAVTVTGVQLDHDDAVVECIRDGSPQRLRCRFAVDCSGRAGVIGRRFREYDPRFRMQALAGVWRRDGAWDLPDESHTVVETFDEGWAWSVPTTPGVRHAVVMIDGGTSRIPRGRTLEQTYRTALARARQLHALCSGASLDRTWACDASLYRSSAYAGRNFLLVGDAGSTIDPLSSFGVKKAFASAWLAATAVHTLLAHPERGGLVTRLFADREQQMYESYLRQSSTYAREAAARYATPFWRTRAEASAASAHEDVNLRHAFERLRSTSTARLRAVDPLPLTTYAVVDGDEIVPALALDVAGSATPLRYVADVDLLGITPLLHASTDVPSLYDAYAARYGRPPLPNFLTAISTLLAHQLVIVDAADTFVAAHRA